MKKEEEEEHSTTVGALAKFNNTKGTVLTRYAGTQSHAAVFNWVISGGKSCCHSQGGSTTGI